MDEVPVDQTTRASEGGQSRSQPYHLCQACLSVLTRADLEIGKFYSHHAGLKDFVQASRMGCYICSWMFDALPEGDQETLGLLADGKIPDYLIPQVANEEYSLDPWPPWGPPSFSDERDRFLRAFFNDYRSGKEDWGEDESCLSFTLLGLKRPRKYSRKHLSICVSLNPRYEEYFPSTTRVYDSGLSNLWVEMKRATNFTPVLMSQQGIDDLGLSTTELPASTSSMGAWKIAEGWIHQCSEQHDCLNQIDPEWYPTRLVERISNKSFRIIRSDSSLFQAKRKYLTLSHMWGDGDFVKLTTDNLSALESGCPVTILRKTFQDALVVAQQMDIPYIWIDSLCIIQSGDDGVDWQRESPMMAQVYANSFCNISADWGDECNGLFFERRSSFKPPYKLYVQGATPPESEFWNPAAWFRDEELPRSPPGDEYYCIAHPWGWPEDDVLESPLNRRGWVMQERLLAPRVLHFSPRQISWECGQSFAWEQTTRRLVNSDDDPDFSKLSSHGFHGLASACEKMRRLKLHNPNAVADWGELVSNYTSCKLTKRSDRLVAIAGIAKALASTGEDQYVAGIWTKRLPHALGWEVLTKKDEEYYVHDPETQYFTPSFSWAAAQGEVYLREWGAEDREYKATVSATFIKYREKSRSSTINREVELWDQVLTNHVFGPMTSPEVEVRMQGILRSCRRVGPPSYFGRPRGYWWLVRQSTDIQNSAVSSCSEIALPDATHTEADFSVKCDRTAEADAEVDSTMYYYTILSYHVVQYSEWSVPGDYGSVEVEGLLLKSVDAIMGRFERVGGFETGSSYLESASPMEHDLGMPLGNERELPAWSFDETTGQHTFYIV